MRPLLEFFLSASVGPRGIEPAWIGESKHDPEFSPARYRIVTIEGRGWVPLHGAEEIAPSKGWMELDEAINICSGLEIERFRRQGMDVSRQSREITYHEF